MDDELGLSLSDFEALGEYAPAGLRATELALERAARSFGQSRVPIAGAAVLTEEGGELTTVTVGNNGRIPPPDSDSIGYPTDHGETAAVREIDDVSSWDWSRVVFTTTLSPCIMCTRTLMRLHTLGLNKIVIAESQSFPGAKHLLAELPGMTLVELTNAAAVRMMQAFARTYPWDWAADIGEIPPGDLAFATSLASKSAERERLLTEVAAQREGDFAAGVVDPQGALVAVASDRRQEHGDNSCFSAPMIAMGEAGSRVNLRECALVFSAAEAGASIGVTEFGHTSLGACELFRPAVVLGNATFDEDLRAKLEAAGVEVLCQSDGGKPRQACA